MNVFDLFARIGLDTSEYEKGIKRASKMTDEVKKPLSDYKKDVMKLAQQYKSSGTEMSDAMKKAYSEIDKSEYEVRESHKKAGKEVDKLKEKEKKAGDEAEKTGNKFSGFSEKVRSGAEKIKSGLATMAKVSAVALGAAATGITVLTKAAVDNYASYEQLVGGVDTLFKDSSQKVQQYANEAYKTAGMSANAYMETVTSFSASLLQSLDGDTEKAADVADMAIRDMSDNANKMGTDMESIQNAYQGFAKQNYTMLDNLKLGYGGTKEEMQRLLADAQAISGVQYDISNLNDVYQAIHVIQGELDITGTTSKEAATTIEGSLNSMKSAWTNLLTGLGNKDADLSGLIDQFVESAKTFGGNILPVVEQAIIGIGSLIESLLPQIIAEIPRLIDELFPQFTSTIEKLIMSVETSISENQDAIFDGINQLLDMAVNMIVNGAPKLIKGITKALKVITKELPKIAEKLIEALPEIIETLSNAIAEYLPVLVDTALKVIVMLAEALPELIPQLLSAIVDMLPSIISVIMDNIPALIQAVLDTIVAIAEALPELIPQLIDAIFAVIPQIIDVLIDSIPEILEAVVKIIVAIAETILAEAFHIYDNFDTIKEKIIETFENIVTKALELGKSIPKKLGEGVEALAKTEVYDRMGDFIGKIVDKFKDIKEKMKKVGKNIIDGIVEGIKGAWDTATDAVADFTDFMVGDIKDRFGIHSPSRVMRDEVGKFLALGVGVGFEDEIGQVTRDINSSISDIGNVDLGTSKKQQLGGIPFGTTAIPQNAVFNWYMDGQLVATVIKPFLDVIFGADIMLAEREG